MTTYVTGDMHGDIDIGKLSSRSWPEGATLGPDDRVVICGDFGLIWSNPRSLTEEWWLDWLESKPWGETCFVDGNHENHDMLDAMPVTTWHGGRVHRIPGHPSVIHLMRGETYDVDGDVWWCFGGAQSHDRRWRVEGESWWARELPSSAEMAHGVASLERVGYAPDYVFTHECPTRLIRNALSVRELFDAGYNPSGNVLSDYLERVDDRIDWSKCSRWYCGHYHRDADLDYEGRHVLLFERVVRLGEDAS